MQQPLQIVHTGGTHEVHETCMQAVHVRGTVDHRGIWAGALVRRQVPTVSAEPGLQTAKEETLNQRQDRATRPRVWDQTPAQPEGSSSSK